MHTLSMLNWCIHGLTPVARYSDRAFPGAMLRCYLELPPHGRHPRERHTWSMESQIGHVHDEMYLAVGQRCCWQAEGRRGLHWRVQKTRMQRALTLRQTPALLERHSVPERSSVARPGQKSWQLQS